MTDKTVEETLARFADNSPENTRLPQRAVDFMRGFFHWGLSLNVKDAKVLCLIMMRIKQKWDTSGLPEVQDKKE